MPRKPRSPRPAKFSSPPAYLAGTLALFLLLALTALFLQKNILPGVKAGGVALGGLSENAAIAELEKHLSHRPDPVTILGPTGLKVSVPFNELPLKLDAASTAAAAGRVGRQGLFLETVWDRIVGTFGEINVPFQTRLEETALAPFITGKLAAFETPVKSAAVQVVDTRLTVEPAVAGRQINRPALTAALLSFLEGQTSVITIVVEPVTPLVSTEQAAAARQAAEALLATSPYIVQVQNADTWSLNRATLLGWLVFDFAKPSVPDLDRNKIKDFFMSVAPSVSTAPVNAVLGADQDNKIVIEEPDVVGLVLDPSATAEVAYRHLLAADPQKIAAVVTETPAQIREAALATLGLTSLIATGTTDFRGSSQSRSHNISVGAARFNGLLIPPGANFSFNARLGEVGPEQGYLPELVIKETKTVPEYGGGLCQVSTTLFRAAVYAGLTVTERQSHSYAVRYYNPAGFDATIYPPYPDLKFTNTTPANIYLQSSIKGTLISFQIFGTADGRTVKLTGPTVYASDPDGSTKTVLTQEVLAANGDTLLKKKFYSYYRPPALFPVIRNPLE